MTAITDRDTGPWYRQTWPWIILLLLGWGVVAAFSLLYFAISSNDGLVVDDYYRQGRTIDRTIARSEHAAELGLTADVSLRAGEVDIRLSANEAESLPETIIVSIVHPTLPGRDQTIQLNGRNGAFSGELAPLSAGRWLVQIEDGEKAWRLRGAVQLPDESRSTIYPFER